VRLLFAEEVVYSCHNRDFFTFRVIPIRSHSVHFLDWIEIRAGLESSIENSTACGAGLVAKEAILWNMP
jgi:hypothetical protein